MPVLVQLPLSTIISNARELARANSTSLPDADAIILANEVKDEIVQKIIDMRLNVFVEEDVRDITAAEIVGGSSPGRFNWPADMYLLKEIMMNLQDPTNQDLWKKSDQVDTANLPMGVDVEWLRKNQSILSPLHTNWGDYFEMFPTPLVALVGALKIHHYVPPRAFVATDDNVPYPFHLDRFLLAYGIAARYLEPVNDTLAAKRQKTYEDRTDRLIASFGSGEQDPPEVKGLPLTGVEF